MESVITTTLLLIGPIVMLAAYKLFPDWFNARRAVTVGITAAMVLAIIAGSWAWSNHRTVEARRMAPVLAIDPAERARMDAGAGLKY